MRGTLIALAAVATAVSAAAGWESGQPPQAPVTATELVARASQYVDAYIDAFSAVVSEEKQTQTLIRADGRVRQTRIITPDFLLVKARGTWPEAFRDVIEVDGKPVRNREDRLRKLFLDKPKQAVELADAIAQESGRYNIGPPRRGNSPMVPIVFLTSRVAEGVRFEGPASALAFQEVRRPTVMTSGRGKDRRDLPARGKFEIEPATGRVLAAEFTAVNPDARSSAMYTVRYAIDPKLAISVPVEVTERYWYSSKPDNDRVEVRATYSSFRRFQVTTGEEIKK